MMSYAGTRNWPLKVKHIHIDVVSPSFMLFVKDTLAPNTLESVFLHETVPYYMSTFSMDDIYQTALCRNRLSLKKLLVKAIVSANFM